MAKIIGVSGSLRRKSFNTAALHAAAAAMPEGHALAVRSVRGIPLYDADVEERDGIPPAVAELKEEIVAADGLLLATPEYNGSLPGVLKNALDWLTRPPADIRRVLAAKPVALLGASAGGYGTAFSQNAWLPVLRALGMQPWFGGRLLIPHAGDVFDGDGRLVDDRLRERLETFVRGFSTFVDHAR